MTEMEYYNVLIIDGIDDLKIHCAEISDLKIRLNYIDVRNANAHKVLTKC